MKTQDLVNGYVLPNLFYELMFLDEHGLNVGEIDWADEATMDSLIRSFVLPRFESFKAETKTVVYNTLRFLLAKEGEDSELLERIWQASSAPIPTPKGIRHFVSACYEALFPDVSPPSSDELAGYRVNHDPQIAIRLN